VYSIVDKYNLYKYTPMPQNGNAHVVKRCLPHEKIAMRLSKRHYCIEGKCDLCESIAKYVKHASRGSCTRPVAIIEKILFAAGIFPMEKAPAIWFYSLSLGSMGKLNH